MEKMQLSRATEVEELTEEEYATAWLAVRDLREKKAKETEVHPISAEDAQKATATGRVHGDPFFVVE